jgi:pimeloyl-ACP methyl ester carboxylesterase
MAELTRDRVRIHYAVAAGPGEEGRSGARLPVLLSHGFGASSRMWNPNVAALAAARPVITWDLRGHGRSESPADAAQYSHQASVADMAALLDACDAPRAVLGGLSLGGYLSLAFWLAHPERVAALMLFDTGPGYRNAEARQGWNDRAEKTAERYERRGLSRPGAEARDSAGALESPGDPEHTSAQGLAFAARGMLAQQDASVIECLPSIDVPVLVVVGANDQPFLGAADYVAAKVPGATKVVIPDAGHVCNVDQPELFSREVLAFLAGLGKLGP